MARPPAIRRRIGKARRRQVAGSWNPTAATWSPGSWNPTPARWSPESWNPTPATWSPGSWNPTPATWSDASYSSAHYSTAWGSDASYSSAHYSTAWWSDASYSLAAYHSTASSLAKRWVWERLIPAGARFPSPRNRGLGWVWCGGRYSSCPSWDTAPGPAGPSMRTLRSPPLRRSLGPPQLPRLRRHV